MTGIPKKIHYVWGYGEPKSKLTLICLVSWKKMMPKYEIIEWNEKSIDFDLLAKECSFFSEAYRLQHWSYMSDYIRLKVLYEQGGIYLDTDVQVLKKLDAFLGYRFFAGFHHGFNQKAEPTDGLVEGSVMGAVPQHPFIGDMIKYYQKEMLTSDLAYQPYAINYILQRDYGLSSHPVNKNSQLRKGIALFSSKYFHPYNRNSIGLEDSSSIFYPETYTVHWKQNSYHGKLKYHLFMNYRNASWGKRLRFIIKHCVVKTFKSIYQFLSKLISLSF